MRYIVKCNPFEDTINLKELAEEIALGPQEEVINEITELNGHYGTSFRVTPTFRWQPGFYKKLCVETERITAVTTYKNKVSTYFNNIDNKNWTYKNFRDRLKRLDQKLYYLRRENAKFQDNTDNTIDAYNNLLDKISETQYQAHELFPHISSCVHICSAESREGRFSVDVTKQYLVYEIKMRDVKTTINVGNSPVTVNMGGIEILIAVDLRKNIYNRLRELSAISSGTTHGYHTTSTGGYFEPLEDDILFPYITTRNGYNQGRVILENNSDDEIDFQNICFGSFSEHLIESFWRGDLITAYTYLDQWASRFTVGITGPLNDFKRMFHGCWPEMDNDQWRNSEGFFGPDRCMYGATLTEDDWKPDQMESSYCERYKCVFRNNGCVAYDTIMNPDPGNQLEPVEDGNEIADQDGEPFDPMSMAVEDIPLPDPPQHQVDQFEEELLRNYNNINTINIGVREDGE